MNVQMGAKFAFPQEMCLSSFLRTDLTCISTDENYFPLLAVSYNLALWKTPMESGADDWESIF